MSRHWWVLLLVAGFLVEGYELWQLQTMRRELRLAVQGRDDNVILPEIGTVQFLTRDGFTVKLRAANYVNTPAPPLSPLPGRLNGIRFPATSGVGIHLAGFIGNPTNLWVSNLALTFTAIRIRYEIVSVGPAPMQRSNEDDGGSFPHPTMLSDRGSLPSAQPLLSLPGDLKRPPLSQDDLRLAAPHANDELFLFGPGVFGESKSVEVGELNPGGISPFEVTIYPDTSISGGFQGIDNTSLQRQGIRFTVVLNGERYSPISIPLQ